MVVMFALQVASTTVASLSVRDVVETLGFIGMAASAIAGSFRLGAFSREVSHTRDQSVTAINDLAAQLVRFNEFIDKSIDLRREWAGKEARWNALSDENAETNERQDITIEMLRSRADELGHGINTMLGKHALLEQAVNQHITDDRRHFNDRKAG